MAVASDDPSKRAHFRTLRRRPQEERIEIAARGHGRRSFDPHPEVAPMLLARVGQIGRFDVGAADDRLFRPR